MIKYNTWIYIAINILKHCLHQNLQGKQETQIWKIFLYKILQILVNRNPNLLFAGLPCTYENIKLNYNACLLGLPRNPSNVNNFIKISIEYIDITG